MILEGARKKIGAYFLKQEIKSVQRKPQLVSLSSANSAIVLFECVDETTLTLVNKFIKRLREEEGIFKIEVLAYFNGKEMPNYLSSAKFIQSYNEKELNWYLFPEGETIEKLLKQEYDILIDLSLGYCFQTTVLCAKTKAKMKVGKKMPNNLTIHDIFVDIKDSESMPYLIEQVIHFLKMFNKSKLKHG